MIEKNKISLIGMPSAGKTSTCDLLGKKLKCEVYHLDEMVEEKEGKNLISIWKEKGANYFLDIEAHILEKISRKERCVISPAGSIIFSPRGIKWLEENTEVIFLDTPISKIKKRLSEKPKVVVGGESKSIEQVYKERLPLYKRYADIIISPKEKSLDKVSQEILEKIGWK